MFRIDRLGDLTGFRWVSVETRTFEDKMLESTFLYNIEIPREEPRHRILLGDSQYRRTCETFIPRVYVRAGLAPPRALIAGVYLEPRMKRRTE